MSSKQRKASTPAPASPPAPNAAEVDQLLAENSDLIAQVAELRAVLNATLRQRGLLGEVTIDGSSSAAASYASPADLVAIDDLIELDVVIKRWFVSGRPLKLRVRALDIDQQELIDIESTIKHGVTGEWVRSEGAYAAATLREAVIVPSLDNAKAQLMRKRNPTIVQELVKLIWSLSAIDDALLERLINIDDPQPPTAAELSPAGQ